MNKTLYLVSNAHLDPVWQWEWEEGAAAAVSTFRTAARFLRERDGYIFCHNEAALYEWVEEYEPPLFEEIRALVKEGRWIIIGGWYIQPDCNMPAGETFVRQALYGRKYFREKFGVVPVLANNFDSFGHSRGLAQILAKTGYKYYMHCRPGQTAMPDTYRWIGYDGSEVICERQTSGYGTGLGGAADKAKGILASLPDGGRGICLWGVGDHGGGASEIDLDRLGALAEEAGKNGDRVFHADPNEYFEGIDPDTLPEWTAGANPWAVGCYTSQASLKSAYRALEDDYYSVEKMCMHSRGTVPYPAGKLREALKAMLFATFHDYLPGTSVEPVEKMGLRQIGGARDSLTRLRAASFFAMCGGQRKAGPDEIPVLVYNPHPYPVKSTFECEFMLWDQGWGDTVKQPRLYDENGSELPCQQEKELSSIPIDWRKRVVFEAEAAPSSVSRWNFRFRDVKKEPAASLPEENGRLVFRGKYTKAAISLTTGLLESYATDNGELLDGGACRLDVLRDNCDPWGMTVDSYRDVEGCFTLLDPEEAARFCAVPGPLAPVRVIENGPVRAVVEALLGRGDSRAVVRYALSYGAPGIDVSVRLDMCEKQKMVKLVFPVKGFESVTGQTAYGSEELPSDGREGVSQRWRAVKGSAGGLLVTGRSTYGTSVEGNEFKISLVRTAAYTAHPLGDREILPEDRFMPHFDLGSSLFEFRLEGAADFGVLAGRAERISQTWCEKPFCMSFFPSGEGSAPERGLVVEGGDSVVLTAYKEREYGSGDIIRLFNPLPDVAPVRIISSDGEFDVSVGPRAFETFLKKGNSLEKIRADEIS